MELLIFTTVLSFLGAHSSFIGNIIKKWNNKQTLEEQDLLKEKESLKIEQQQLNMIDQFAKYSKIQRKINAIEEKLTESKEQKKSVYLQMFSTYGVQAVCSLILVILSVWYRRSYLFKLDEDLDLFPLNYMISYPNDKNTVSVHFWIMCCNVVFRTIKV